MTEVKEGDQIQNIAREVEIGFLGEQRAREVEDAFRLNGNPRVPFEMATKSLMAEFSGRVDGLVSKITQTEEYRSSKDADDLLRSVRDKPDGAIRSLTSSEAYRLAADLVIGNNALEKSGGGSIEATPGNFGLNTLATDPLTEKWVSSYSLKREADGVNPEIRKEAAARVLAIQTFVSRSADVQSISPQDAKFVTALTTGTADEGDALSVTDARACGKGLQELWAAEQSLRTVAEQVLRKTFLPENPSQADQFRFDNAAIRGGFDRVFDDFNIRLPEAIVPVMRAQTLNRLETIALKAHHRGE